MGVLHIVVKKGESRFYECVLYKRRVYSGREG